MMERGQDDQMSKGVTIEIVLRDHRSPVAHCLALMGKNLDDLVVDGKVDRAVLKTKLSDPRLVDTIADGFEETLRRKGD